MPEIDRYALVTLGDLIARVTRAYDDWKFHQVYRAVFDYCVVDLSSFYLDVLKDRLYSDGADSLSRRSAQTVIAEVLTALVRLVAPVLTFTSEEVWQFMPEALREGHPSVQLAGWPQIDLPAEEAARLRDDYRVVLEVRESVTKALEDARNDKVVNKSQEAAVTLTVPPATLTVLEELGAEAVAEMFIVSDVSIVEGEDVSVAVEPATGDKCPRCWNYRETGIDPSFPELCGRCAEVLAAG
jgi:isoleucyl-tRNA synthetase